MQATTTSGLKFEVEISGYREAPIITIPAQTIKGMKFSGEGAIAASQKRTGNTPMPADSLCFRSGGKNVFFRMDLAPIRAAIAALPRKVRMARKVTETRDLDGDVCPVSIWKFDGVCISPKTGDYISSKHMGDFLTGRGISEIEIGEACQMWADEMETDEMIASRKAESQRFAAISQQWADEEEMENGSILRTPRDPTPEYPREG